MNPSQIIKSDLPYADKARLLRKHGGESHDQRGHGNWARGMSESTKKKVLAHADKEGISPEAAAKKIKSGRSADIERQLSESRKRLFSGPELDADSRAALAARVKTLEDQLYRPKSK